jgi:hypothetical protein
VHRAGHGSRPITGPCPVPGRHVPGRGRQRSVALRVRPARTHRAGAARQTRLPPRVSRLPLQGAWGPVVRLQCHGQ